MLLAKEFSIRKREPIVSESSNTIGSLFVVLSQIHYILSKNVFLLIELNLVKLFIGLF